MYVVWIEPNLNTYFYDVQDLRSIALVEPLFVGPDGGVYRLSPP